jgi:hypothetical protein
VLWPELKTNSDSLPYTLADWLWINGLECLLRGTHWVLIKTDTFSLWRAILETAVAFLRAGNERRDEKIFVNVHSKKRHMLPLFQAARLNRRWLHITKLSYIVTISTTICCDRTMKHEWVKYKMHKTFQPKNSREQHNYKRTVQFKNWDLKSFSTVNA